MINPFQASRPSGLWYLLPVVIMAVSVAVFIASLGSVGREVRSDVAAMPRVVFPEGGAIELPREGPYGLLRDSQRGGRPGGRGRAAAAADLAAGHHARRRDRRGDQHPLARKRALRRQGDLRPAAYSGLRRVEVHSTASRHVPLFRRFFRSAAAGSDSESRASQASGEASEAESPRFVVAVGNLGLQEHFSSWTGLFGAAAMVAVAMVVAVTLAIWVYVKRNPGRWSRSPGQPHTAG